MTDGMPSSYDTTTTTTTVRTVFCDKNMLRSKEGLLKLGQALMCLIGLICVACARNSHVSEASFFYFVATVGLIVAIVLLVLYVTHVRDKIAGPFRLNFLEMVYNVVWCLFFLAGSIACIVHGGKFYDQNALVAAGVFGLVATALYGLDAFIMYKAWKTGATRSATQTTQHASTPAY